MKTGLAARHNDPIGGTESTTGGRNRRLAVAAGAPSTVLSLYVTYLVHPKIVVA